MIKKIMIGVVLVLGFAVAGIFFKFESEKERVYTLKPFSIAEEIAQADVALGERIYHVRAGCVDCHGKNLAGASIMDNGAMGTIKGANITPSGLGDWSDREIAGAIRYGIHKSGRSLRFMPSFDYEGLSKSDIAALIAYIRSVDSVESAPTENTFGPVAKVMGALGKMPVMFPAAAIDHSKGFVEKPEEQVSHEFGKYLASSCVGCHGADYQGGPIPGGDPSWPEATSLKLGAMPEYTEESFHEMIKTGISPVTKKALRAPMPVALLKQLNEKEIKSLWLFLKSLK